MKVKNPILRGFYPDPSIVRVGDDYYIANSTFEWWPGSKPPPFKRSCALGEIAVTIKSPVTARPARCWCLTGHMGTMSYL